MGIAGVEKLKWYVNRMRSMPLPELGFRVYSLVGHFYWASCEAHKRKEISSTTSHELFARFEMLLPSSSETNGRILKFLNVEVEARDFDFLRDFRNPTFSWPRARSSSIEYKLDDDSDPRWNWEANRLLFLIPMVRHPDEEVRSLGLNLLRDWLKSDVPNHGVHWEGGIEVGIRAIALTAIHGAISMQKPVDFELIQSIGLSIGSHISYLKRHASRYSSANNHRIVEIVSILILSSYWPKSFHTNKVRRLESELAGLSEKMFFSDGVFKEQSTTYAAFTLEFIALALSSRQWAIEDSRGRVMTVFSKGITALATFTTQGALTLIGDNDSGRLFPESSRHSSWVESISNVAGMALPHVKEGMTKFPSGGYTVVRSDSRSLNYLLVFDHGSFGYAPLYAHAHDDGLSLWLVAKGHSLILEPGCYSYHRAREQRNFYRSRSAHNGPISLRQAMPLPTGAFNWGSWKPFYGTNKGSSLAAENEVTAQLLNPPSGTVSVARRLVVSPIDGTFSITDSAPSTNVQSRYLLAGSFSILEQTKRSVTLGQSQWNISLSFSLDSGNIGHVQINESKFSPLLGIEERCLELIIATPEDNISYTIKLEELDKNS